jgi:hypothetical protein
MNRIKINRKLVCRNVIFFIFLAHISINVNANTDLINIDKVGKVHHFIKHNLPIKNNKNFNWDELLIDIITNIQTQNQLVTSSYLIQMLEQHYKMFDSYVKFYTIEPCLTYSNIEDFYYYKHYGIGSENALKKSNSSYYSVIKKVYGDSNRFVNKEMIYKIDDSLYLKITLPNRLKSFHYNSLYSKNIDIHKKYQNANIRLASILKAYYSLAYKDYHNPSLLEDSVKHYLFKKVVSNNSISEFIYTMNSLLSFYNDGHCQFIYGYSKGFIRYDKYPYYPKLNTYLSNDGYLKISSFDNIYDSLFLQNDTIVSVNGKTIDCLINEKISLVSAGTEDARLAKAASLIFESYTRDSIFHISIKRGETIHKFEIATNNIGIYEKGELSLPVIYLNDTSVLIDLTNINLTLKLFKSNLHKIKNAKIVLFNLNGYPNYNTHYVLSHFINKPIYTSQFIVPISYSNCNRSEQDTSSWFISPTEPYIKSDLIFLTNQTMSYGETILEMVDYYDLGIIVGGSSANTNGDVCAVSLPLGELYMTGLTPKRNGLYNLPIKPDIKMEFGLKQNLSNVDFLNKLLEGVVNSNIYKLKDSK